MGRVTERRRVVRIRNGGAGVRPDTLVAEEPLEIRLNGKPLAITMRTPGDDFALAVGFLVSEGVLAAASDVQAVTYCEGATEDGSNTYNVVNVQLAAGIPVPDITLERNVYTTSSCGLCGKASLDAVRTATRFPGLATDPVRVPAEVLCAMPDRLREAQKVFDRTGGLHAAGLFTAQGELLDLREDVGRRQRGGQDRGPGVPGRAASAGGLGPAGVGPGLLRAGAEGRDGGHPGTGGRLGAVLAGGGPGPGVGDDAGRLPAGPGHEHLRGRGADHPVAVRLYRSQWVPWARNRAQTSAPSPVAFPLPEP